MIKVVSLFDGMACGLQALKQAGVLVSEYHAFEIDKHAIKIAKKNHLEIIHHGSVVDFDFSQFKDIDLLIGGSPCQGFSFAGKQLAFDDPRSKLFFEFVRAKNEMSPRYFLLENVVMKKVFQDVITQYMGVEPVMINSALVSAQNRKRLYWANWHIEQPKDMGVLWRDVEDISANNVNSQGWHNWWLANGAYQIDKGYSMVLEPYEKSKCLMARDVDTYPAALRGRRLEDGVRKDYNTSIPIQQYVEINVHNKSNCLSTVLKDTVVAEGDAPRTTAITRRYRFVTPIEAERLQTLPDNYTEGVSDTQRYKMLGNGWTVKVIEHIFKSNFDISFRSV